MSLQIVRHAVNLVGLVGAIALACPTAEAQAERPDISDLKGWATGAERTQIPWKVSIGKASLTFDLRLQILVQVEVRGKDLLRKGEDHDLTLYMELKDAETSETLGYAIRRVRAHPGMPKRDEVRINKERVIVFDLPVFVLPGRYAASFVLHDSTTGARNFGRRTFNVKPIGDELVRIALTHTPRVEFVPSQQRPDPLLPLQLKAHLSLPVESRKRIRLQILVNCCTPQTVVQALSVLSQISLKNGLIDVCVLDPSKGHVIFEQGDFTPRDWPVLATALERSEPSFDKFDGLFSLTPSSQPFIEAVSRASSPEPAMKPRAHNDQPYWNPSSEVRVMIVVSRPTVYVNGSLKRSAAINGTNVSHAFYLRLMTDLSIFKPDGPSHDPLDRLDPQDVHDQAWDSIPKILRPFDPRVFTVHDPNSFRHALAKIMEQLSVL